ncbi:MAG: hypothetical protein GY796_27570 [Chloroflexi bacterium]|nr:hypothetical protein [Chloroflexota bacterium]
MSENTSESQTSEKRGAKLSEDWLAVILAFGLILLSVVGILGENGLTINF